MASAPLLLAVGAVLGCAGAVLGVGGGVLLVPVLHLVFDVPLRIAVGTSLVVVTGTAVTAAAGYLRRGLPRRSLAMELEIGAMAGALATALVAPGVPPAVVAKLFAGALVWVAAMMWWRHRIDPGSDGAAVGWRRVAAWSASPLAGGAAGLLGVGGGLLQVPILRLLLGVDMLRSVATSTLTVGWTASVAALVYWRRGDLDLDAVPWLLAGTLIGGAGAPAIAERLPRRALESAFGLLLLYASIRMWGSS